VTSIEHTAYPRLKRTLTAKELDQIYTPTPAELFLAHRTAKGPVATLGFLIHLKVFQRLGYAVATSEIPVSIIEYIAVCATIPLSSRDLAGYDDSGTRRPRVAQRDVESQRISLRDRRQKEGGRQSETSRFSTGRCG
jgi:hypothetical protein